MNIQEQAYIALIEKQQARIEALEAELDTKSEVLLGVMNTVSRRQGEKFVITTLEEVQMQNAAVYTKVQGILKAIREEGLLVGPVYYKQGSFSNGEGVYAKA